jgi:ABC-type amino acid transport substrate-binding protein
MVTASNNGHLGFTREGQDYPYLADFKNRFDATIRRMKDAGEIGKIVERYLK